MTLIKTVSGFDIHFTAEPEYMSLSETFDDSVTDLNQLSDDIDSGKYIYFCAKVTASKNGIELASDYLGACCYDSEEDFIENSGYFEDMTETVINEAKEAIITLCEQ